MPSNVRLAGSGAAAVSTSILNEKAPRSPVWTGGPRFRITKIISLVPVSQLEEGKVVAKESKGDPPRYPLITVPLLSIKRREILAKLLPESEPRRATGWRLMKT